VSDHEGRISPGQALFLVLIGVVAGGIYIWPATVVRAAGQASLVSTLGTCLVACVVLYLWTRLCPGGLLAILDHPVGRALAIAYAFLLAAYLVDVLALFATLSTKVLNPRTSPLVFLFVAAGAATWIAVHPFASIARLAQLWTPIVLLLTVAVGLGGLHEMDLPGALLPSLGRQPLTVWHGIEAGVYLWTPYPILLTVAGRLRWRQFRPIWLGLVGQCLTLLWLYAVVAGTMGTWPIVELHWPVVFVYETIELNSFFIAEIGVLVVVLWTVSFVLWWAINLWHLGLLAGPAGRLRPARSLLWPLAAGLGLLAALLMGFPRLAEDILSSAVGLGVTVWTVAVLLAAAVFRWRDRQPPVTEF
jgi:hypothetical protein